MLSQLSPFMYSLIPQAGIGAAILLLLLLFFRTKACFILMTNPFEAIARPLCTDMKEALLLALFLLGQSLEELFLLSLEALFLALLCVDLRASAWLASRFLWGVSAFSLWMYSMGICF